MKMPRLSARMILGVSLIITQVSFARMIQNDLSVSPARQMVVVKEPFSLKMDNRKISEASKTIQNSGAVCELKAPMSGSKQELLISKGLSLELDATSTDSWKPYQQTTYRVDGEEECSRGLVFDLVEVKTQRRVQVVCSVKDPSWLGSEIISSDICKLSHAEAIGQIAKLLRGHFQMGANFLSVQEGNAVEVLGTFKPQGAK